MKRNSLTMDIPLTPELLSPHQHSVNSESQPRWFLAAVSVLMGLASLLVGQIMPINDDDAFYLHTWWLYGQGYVPYRDFVDGLPGLWLLLAPAAWLPWTPSSWITFGRALVAISFGVSFWVVGRLVRAYRWEAVLLGAMALVVMLRTEWFAFRRAYFEALFLALHLWFLSRLPKGKRVGLLAGLAGWCVGMMCMTSQRGAFYLHLQPIIMLWAFWGRWPMLGRAALGWMVGGLLAALPTTVYLTYHQLWSEMWTWLVVFPQQAGFTRPMWLTPKTALWMLVAAPGILGLLYDQRLNRQQSRFILIAWVGILAATLVNLTPLHYTETMFQLLTAGLLAVGARALVDRIPPPAALQRVGAASLLVLVGLAAYGLIAKVYQPAPWAVAAQVHRQQAAVLDWLAQLSQGEPVLAIDPYHPMLVPDATFLRGAWQYRYWLRHPQLREQLMGIGQQIVHCQPPVISVNPWPQATAQLDLIQWLSHHGILTPSETDAVGQMIQKNYMEIQFPGIWRGPWPSARKQPGQPYRGFLFGDRFWVRQDRLAACPPPEIPHQIQRPSLSLPSKPSQDDDATKLGGAQHPMKPNVSPPSKPSKSSQTP